MSTKLQITLPEPLLTEIKAAAAGEGVPLAEFIRESVRERLMACKSKRSDWRDPFTSITDLVDSEETDLSMRVDEILYGNDPHQ